jgi:hypothetical protein
MKQRQRRIAALLISIAIGAATASGCVQMPTEHARIPDMRPQLAFRLADQSVRDARVIVDGIDMGAAGDFVDGIAALRVLPGTHLLKVTLLGASLLDEKFYVGDGVHRTFTVNRGF